MTTHPFMPLYVDDYEAATAHLSAAEDGVYSRLLRLCWRTPGCSLPNDDAWIARKIRLSAAEFAKVAKPVIDEFFSVQRGRLIQKRLKAEYENISRKKTARVNAGKMGGDAKALKTKKQEPSKATVLPADTRAFPEPEPKPLEEPPTPLRLEPFAKLIGLSASGAFAEIVEAIWLAQPSPGGKRRSARPDVRDALAAAMKRGAVPSEVLRAIRAYYALPASRKDQGQFASGAQVVMAKDRWREYLPGQQAQPPPTAIDPAYRQHCERHYAATGEWKPEWGEKPRQAA